MSGLNPGQFAEPKRYAWALHTDDSPPGERIPSNISNKEDDVPENLCRHWKLYNKFHTITKHQNTWPPENVILQDWHVYGVIQAVNATERCKMWYRDFESHGKVRSLRRSTGRAAKQFDPNTGAFTYLVYKHYYQLHGDEGAAKFFSPFINDNNESIGPSVSRDNCWTSGDKAIIQSEFIPTDSELLGDIDSGRFPTNYDYGNQLPKGPKSKATRNHKQTKESRETSEASSDIAHPGSKKLDRVSKPPKTTNNPKAPSKTRLASAANNREGLQHELIDAAGGAEHNSNGSAVVLESRQVIQNPDSSLLLPTSSSVGTVHVIPDPSNSFSYQSAHWVPDGNLDPALQSPLASASHFAILEFVRLHQFDANRYVAADTTQVAADMSNYTSFQSNEAGLVGDANNFEDPEPTFNENDRLEFEIRRALEQQTPVNDHSEMAHPGLNNDNQTTDPYGTGNSLGE